MGQIIIEKLTESEYQSFAQFLHDNWRNDHIFISNKWIFDFQHQNADGCYNFLIAKIDGQIVGVLGYIPIAHYDNELDDSYAWGAIWKVVPKAPIGLGLKMLKHILKQYPRYGAVGLSDDAIKMYKALGYSIGVINQYYILNPKIDHYKIAIAKTPCVTYCNSENLSVEDLSSIVNISNIDGAYSPRKSITYFINRYENHPVYKYRFLHILSKLLISYRIIDVDGAKCLRIVDVLGNLSAIDSLYSYLIALLDKYEAEYIDCLNYGVEEEVFHKHGFLTLNCAASDVVIPNYFEPFDRRNIVLFGGNNTKDSNYTFFKGDADQDRPNIIEKND